MFRLLFVLVAGIVGAGLLHIVIVLALPAYAERDVWTRIVGLGPDSVFHVLPPNEPDGLTSTNPFLRTAVCRFDISREPVRVSASGTIPYWSLAVFDPDANEAYSMNDRIVTASALDIVIATPLQMIGYRKTLPEDLANSVIIEFPDTDGYVVLRTVAPDGSWEALTQAFLGGAVCQPVSSY